MSMQPWMDSERWAERDPKLLELSTAPVPFPHTQRLADSIPVHPAGIVLLRGPRQVGKSTLLRQFAQRCLAEGIAPQSIALLDAERCGDRHELAGEITAFREGREGYCVILLDEFTSIEEWWLSES